MRLRTRSLVASLAIAATLSMALAPITAAAETVHLYFRSQTGPVRMIGLAGGGPHESMSLNFMVAGLPATGKHRLVGSARACSRAHVGSATVFELDFGPAGDDRVVRRVDASTPKLTEATARSVRLFTRHSGGVQRTCARVAQVETAIPAGLSFNFEEIVAGTFGGPVKGLTVFQFSDAEARVSSILVGLPAASTSRLMATDDACTTAVTSGDMVARERVSANAKGVIAIIDRPVDHRSLGREDSIECLSVMKGPSGKVRRASTVPSGFHAIS